MGVLERVGPAKVGGIFQPEQRSGWTGQLVTELDYAERLSIDSLSRLLPIYFFSCELEYARRYAIGHLEKTREEELVSGIQHAK